MASFVRAISSARPPVPSGDPSSTIRMWASATVASMASAIGPTFSRSLYVGMMIQMLAVADCMDFLAADGAAAEDTASVPSPARRTFASGPDAPIEVRCGGEAPGTGTQRSARRNRSIVLRVRVYWPLLPPRARGPKTPHSSGDLRSGHCRTCHRALYIPSSAACVLRSDPGTVAGPRTFA